MASIKPETVPITQKILLTINEASALSGIGITKMTEMVSDDLCPFSMRNGRKILIKRVLLEEFLNDAATRMI
ncbi:MAG: excisionase [Firmicutes bacterium]|nr:excisionase [Bacillota bacterium]